MRIVSLPQKPKCIITDEHSARFEIHGCYPGYGMTVGNALRRVLLSSLEGAAVTAVKIKGISHEFSTMDGVMEDAVQIILNLKKIRFKMQGEESIKASLKFKGEGKVTAKDFKCPTGLEVVNIDQPIATITDKKVDFEMEIEVTRGLGYVPIEQQQRDEKEIGVIAIDAVYTPIKRVNYEIENMRVGKRTDYNKVTLDIVTDGSITPKEAFEEAVQILVSQFSALSEFEAIAETAIEAEIVASEEKIEIVKEEKEDPLKTKVVELKNLSTRTLNVLEENKIVKIKDILKYDEEGLRGLEGMGDKGIKEIKKSIGEFGLTLKQA
jgi:DNA-directed RNA polymerase subunit alpha